MTHVFKHPKYYTELRKRNKSDQAISPEAHDGERERAPGSGLKPQAASVKLQQVASRKLQASRSKPQAPRSKLQASSPEYQAP